jgi:hypothetical protein
MGDLINNLPNYYFEGIKTDKILVRHNGDFIALD